MIVAAWGVALVALGFALFSEGECSSGSVAAGLRFIGGFQLSFRGDQ